MLVLPRSRKGDDVAAMGAGRRERLMVSSLEQVWPFAPQPKQTAGKLELDLAAAPVGCQLGPIGFVGSQKVAAPGKVDRPPVVGID